MKKKKLDACTKIFSVCDMIHYEHLERKEEKEGRKEGKEEGRKGKEDEINLRGVTRNGTVIL